MTWVPETGFNGPLVGFLEALLSDYYPGSVSARECQNWIDRELRAGIGPFPCRAFSAAVCDSRISVAPKVNFFEDGLPFPVISTDNEPTSSLFAYCRETSAVWRQTMLSALQTGTVTTGLLTTASSSASTRERFARLGLGGGAMNQHRLRVAASGLKLCHIADASDGLESAQPTSLLDELEVRICRTLSPLNVFPFPSPRKYIHRLNGREHSDLGEEPEIQRLFAAVLHRHFDRSDDGRELPAKWFERMRPGYGADAGDRALRTFKDASVEFTPWRSRIDARLVSARSTTAPVPEAPRVQPATAPDVPAQVRVNLDTLARLNVFVHENPQTASETKFCLRTDHLGWRFEVERPTTAKVAELLAAASVGGLTVVNRVRSGRATGAPQYKSQFGSCYLVRTDAWQQAWNYLE